MNHLHQILGDYLSIRRSLGFKLEREGTLLPDFVDSLEEAQSPVITSALALAWATKPTNANPYWWARRLGLVRVFARYVHTLDPGTEAFIYAMWVPVSATMSEALFMNGQPML